MPGMSKFRKYIIFGLNPYTNVDINVVIIPNPINNVSKRI
jgi:hypothetical protein